MKRALLLLIALTFTTTDSVFAQNWWKNGIRGEGDLITEDVRLDPIAGIKSAFSCDVYLTQGSSQSIRLEGQENILENLKLEVDREGVLSIKPDRPVRSHKKVTIWITMATLEVVKVAGAGIIKTEGSFNNLGRVTLGVSGSGNLNLDIDAEDIKARVTGSGNMALAGMAQVMDAGIAGSGNINAYDLVLEESEISITGSGSARINVSTALDARIVGSGDIHYKGGASAIDSKITGSGSVRSAR